MHFSRVYIFDSINMESLFWFMAMALLLGAASSHPSQCKGKCPANYPDDDVILLPHENCSLYCSCVFGKPVELPCPPGLEFCPMKHVCTYPSESHCVPGKDKPLFLRSLVLANSTNQNDKLCFGTCPDKDSAEITLLEHEDCGKFCKCEKGVAKAKDCPNGLHFSPALGICTYPYEAHCPRAPEVNPPNVVLPEKPENCLGKCPLEDPEIVVHLPHKYCTKFCKCNLGLPYLFTCPSGLYFNPKLLLCDYPKNAGCKGIQARILL